MSKLTVYQPNLPALEPQRVLQGLDYAARGFVPVRMPIFVVTKLYGGAGADTLLSMVAHWLTQWTVPPLIIQAGGSRGPLSRSYPADRFRMFETLDADVMAKTFDAIVNCPDRPVLVAVDHNLNLAFIEMLESMKSAGLSLRMLCVQILRSVQERPKMLQRLGIAGAQVMGAVIAPPFDDGDQARVVRIPRLPRPVMSMMSEQDHSFCNAIASATHGTQLMMRSSLERFFAALQVIYASDI